MPTLLEELNLLKQAYDDGSILSRRLVAPTGSGRPRNFTEVIDNAIQLASNLSLPVIDINEQTVNRIVDTYVEAFGPLPNEMVRNDIFYEVCELIKEAAHLAATPEPVDLKKVIADDKYASEFQSLRHCGS